MDALIWSIIPWISSNRLFCFSRPSGVTTVYEKLWTAGIEEILGDFVSSAGDRMAGAENLLQKILPVREMDGR